MPTTIESLKEQFIQVHSGSSTFRGRAAVIGSGFGGLAAAIRLQSMGFETVCFEQRDKAGGRAYVYNDSGFTFDAGPTVITAPHSIEELFEAAGQAMKDSIELLPVDPMYRLQWPDGAQFDCVSDEARLVDQIRRISPADVAGYQTLRKLRRRQKNAARFRTNAMVDVFVCDVFWNQSPMGQPSPPYDIVWQSI